MTWRKLLGFTKSMGPFEIAAVWLALPDSIKERVPKPVRDAITALAAAIVAYKLAMKLYGIASKLYAEIAKKQVSASLPPNPAVSTAEQAKQTTEVSATVAKKALDVATVPVNQFLDTTVPGT